MPSTDTLFMYTFFLSPVVGFMLFLWFRCFQPMCETHERILVVEPTHMIQRIHTTEPLEVAEPIHRTDAHLSQDYPLAEFLPAVPLPVAPLPNPS